MTTYFNKLNSIDCNAYTEKKGNLTYLKWAKAWDFVKQNYPDSTYEIHEDEVGFPYWASKFGVDVKTSVTIEGITHSMRLPVMDHRNKAIPLDKVNVFDINKTIMRCLVKNIAMHGLGLYIYLGHDENENAPENLNQEVVNHVYRLTDNTKDKDALADILRGLEVTGKDEIMAQQDQAIIKSWLEYLRNI